MGGIRQFWQGSLVVKLNLPIFISSVILALGVYWFVRFAGEDLERRNTNQLAQFMVDSIVIGTQVNGSNANLIRLVNALGAYREVVFLAIVDEKNHSILACTENHLIGKSLIDSSDTLSDLGLTGKELNHREKKLKQIKGSYSFVSNIRLFETETISLRKLYVVLKINPGRYNIATEKTIYVVGWAVLITMILMMIIVVYIQRVVLIRRINNLKTKISGEMIKLDFVSANKTEGDELEIVSSMYDDLLWAKNVSDIELEKALNLAERSNKVKSDFLANMSHELRTPLNSVIGFSKRLIKKSENLDDRQMMAIESINKSGLHLLSLINDILDLSKIDAGKFELNIQTADLSSETEELLASLEDQLEEKNLQLVTDIEANILADVDIVRYRQISINVISNAIKYTHEGRITVRLCREDENQVMLSVSDTGIGIRKEDQERLFKRFEQFDKNSRFQVGLGTGLGLSIVSEFTRLHGGSVKVESDLGKGSCFSIFLPIKH